MAGVALDFPALRQGVLTAALISVPAGIIGVLVSDNDDLGWLGTLSVVVVLVGLTMGAATAAASQRVGSPLTHGIITALTVFAVVQLVGIVRRTIADEDLDWAKYLSSAFLSVFAGTLGGLLGARRPTRRGAP